MKLSLNMSALKKDETSLESSSTTTTESSSSPATTPENRMDTSEDQVVKPVLPSLQLGAPRTGGFSLNLSGIGATNQQPEDLSRDVQVEEEDEFDSEDMEESPKPTMPTPKFSLKLPSMTNAEPIVPTVKIDQISVDLLIPNLCTLNLNSADTEDVKARIESELDNSIKREDLELFILQPITSLKDITDTDRIVCRAKNSNISVSYLSSLSNQNQELKIKNEKTSSTVMQLTREIEEMRKRIEELEKQKEEAKRLVSQAQNSLATKNL